MRHWSKVHATHTSDVTDITSDRSDSGALGPTLGSPALHIDVVAYRLPTVDRETPVGVESGGH
jgi:hypothetical protein